MIARRHIRVAPSGVEPGGRNAFTLVELLVVIALLAIFAALVTGGVARAMETARAAQCFANMRQLALGVTLFADENNDTFPRSQHSASAYGQLPWPRTVAPKLGSSTTAWRNLLRGAYHCPTDVRLRTLSYGLNVYFELGEYDDYGGKPMTWRRRADIPHPAATVLLAENASLADHIMPNFWGAASEAEDVDSRRHRGKASYAFVDGHVETRTFDSIYEPTRGVDAWNPSTAND